MIRLYTTLFILAGTLSFPLGVSANSSETITTTNVPRETETIRTTETSGNPVVIQDSYGNRTVLQSPDSTTTVDTTTNSGGGQEKTVVKNKSQSHHLFNFLGLKIL
jgi:hypothetical protein